MTDTKNKNEPGEETARDAAGRLVEALDAVSRAIELRGAGYGGGVVLAVDIQGASFSREFASASELGRHGAGALTGLVREALVWSLQNTRAPDVDGLELELDVLETPEHPIGVFSTATFDVADLPPHEPAAPRDPTYEFPRPVEHTQSFRIPRGELPGESHASASRQNTDRKTTLIDQTELLRRLHNTPAEGFRSADIESAHATIVPGNLTTASFEGLEGGLLIATTRHALADLGYGKALITEEHDGRLGIQLDLGLPRVFVRAQMLRNDPMGTLSKVIEKAKSHGVIPS
jgi:hypothetical protein